MANQTLDRCFAFFKWETEWGGWLLLWGSLSLYAWFGPWDGATQAAWATPAVRGTLGTVLALGIALVGRFVYRSAARRVRWVSILGKWVLEWASWCFWLLTPTIVLAILTTALLRLTQEMVVSTILLLLGLLWGCLTTLYVVILALNDVRRVVRLLSGREADTAP